jgi:hypothetical protein
VLKLDISLLFMRFGGPSGLHARLLKCGYSPAVSAVAVRVWKSRGGVPGQFVLPILMLLRDEGEDIWGYVARHADEEAPNPFEGLT